MTIFVQVGVQREEQIAAMEIVAGWLRGSKHAAPAEAEALMQVP